MKNIFLLFLVFSAFSQDPNPQTGALRITWPLNRTVLQMDASNQATINIAGQHVTNDLYPGFLKVRQLQYKIVKLNGKDGKDISDYTNGYLNFASADIKNDISSKDLRTYLKTISLPKGWYRLQVRIRKSLFGGYETLQKQDILFGVGDVYLIAGQSNAAGYSDAVYDPGVIQNANNYEERNAISAITSRKVLESNEIPIKIEGLPINSAIKDANGITIGYSQKGFSRLEKTMSGAFTPIYPRGKGSWCWGPLGSKLVESHPDTPILFFNAAEANTSLSGWADKYWVDDAGNYILPPVWAGDQCTTLPCLNKATYGVYKQFRSSLQMYGHILGLRAILWHQGERDAQNNAASYTYYTTKMNTMINQSRTDIGNLNLSWLSSQVSYYTLLSGGVPVVYNQHLEASPTALNSAQQAVWNSGSKKYPGIFTDDLGADARNSSKP
jgi:Carbohydrate esterase, sialic acid-specific acetylesterase